MGRDEWLEKHSADFKREEYEEKIFREWLAGKHEQRPRRIFMCPSLTCNV